ncbi:MAG: hypothetical protein R2788_18555 [Saprospiraceae bacterium]
MSVFYHTNATGRRDLLVKSGCAIWFYQKVHELIYTPRRPSINPKPGDQRQRPFHQRKGNRIYDGDNELLFHRNDDDVLLQRLRVGGGLFYRKNSTSSIN